jgi:imidazolonepropionase-like amidohydrolase
MTMIVFRNARLFDGSSEELKEGIDIVVEGNRIREVAEGGAGSFDAIEIDVGGRTVLPGLIDAHVHLMAVHLRAANNLDYSLTLMTAKSLPRIKAMLDRGFTTVRDVAGADFGLRQAIAEGLIIGPRAFIGGPGLTQTGGHADHRRRTDSRLDVDRNANGVDWFARIVDGPEAIRLAVRDELRKGADHIKLMASGGVGSPNDSIDDYQFSEEEIRMAVDECAMRGSYVAAHTYGSTAVQRAVKNGVRTVEHCNLIDAETAAVVRDHDAFVVPTLVCYEITEKHGDELGLSPFVMSKLRHVNEAGVRMLEICESAGTRMGFGTDLMGEMEFAQSHEFVIRARVQKPIDVLRSATSVNAEILKRSGELGTVAPGALADLVVVDGDPLVNISLLDGQGENLSLIMKDGDLYKNRLPARETAGATRAVRSAAR